MSTDKEITERLMTYAAEQRAEARKRTALVASLSDKRPSIRIEVATSDPSLDRTAFEIAKAALDGFWERNIAEEQVLAKHQSKLAKASAALAKSPEQAMALVQAIRDYDERPSWGLSRSKVRAILARRGLLFNRGGSTYSPTTLGREIAMVIAGEGEEPACAK